MKANTNAYYPTVLLTHKFWISFITVIALSLSLAQPAWSKSNEGEKPKIPESVPGITTISAPALVEMITTVDDLTIMDARINKGRKKGYIENSIHLADIDTTCESLEKHIPQADSPVVFYCTSSKCGRSLNAVKIAQSCAYKNIYWFRGGFEEWKEHELPYLK